MLHSAGAWLALLIAIIAGSGQQVQQQPECFISALCRQLPAYILHPPVKTLTDLGVSKGAGGLLLLFLPELASSERYQRSETPLIVHFHSPSPAAVKVLMNVANGVIVELLDAVVAQSPLTASVLFGVRINGSIQQYTATEELHFYPHDAANYAATAYHTQADIGPTAAAALSTGHVEFQQHQYGAFMRNQLRLDLSQLIFSLPIDTQWLNGAPLLDEDNSYLEFSVRGLIKAQLPLGAPSVETQITTVEPASWFFTLTPVLQTTATAATASYQMNGLSSMGYTEFVLSDTELAQQRRFNKRRESSVPVALVEQSRSNICIWSADKLDGQRQIWLLQTQHMNASLFRFVWILGFSAGTNTSRSNAATGHEERDADSPHSSSLYDTLQNLPNAVVVKMPNFLIDANDFFDAPSDGGTPFSVIWAQAAGNETKIFEYIHYRMEQTQSYTISEVEPMWCRTVLLAMEAMLLEQRCDLVVYGNSRHFNSDVLITDATKALKIPCVTELLNLFVDERIVPDAIVAPSTHALEHPSVSHVLISNFSFNSTVSHQQENRGRHEVEGKAIGVVIPPSVDIDLFDRRNTKTDERQQLCPLKLSSNGVTTRNCLVVGFVARLAPEKNPGLFLQAAFMILQELPIARFIIIGDGELREALEDLAGRLGISWAVHFAGWIGQQQLPDVLMGIDVVINTSLRGWSETFCIANIEVMSMGIPLVTFAVGGVGEYIDQPDNVFALQFDEFVETANGVIVNQATPMAVARAALHVLRNMTSSQRTALGQRARDTVQSYFIVRRQMRQYEDLYKLLLYRARHGGGS